MRQSYRIAAWGLAIVGCCAGIAPGRDSPREPGRAEQLWAAPVLGGPDLAFEGGGTEPNPAPPDAATEDVSPGDLDWLKIVPGDVGFYVELRDLAGIRKRFLELGIWGAVRRMSELDAGPPASQPARRRGAELLGLNPESAINLVLGRRAAIIASTSSQWRDGVVLAELRSAAEVASLLTRWQARPQPDEGLVRRYLLTGDLRLAVFERTLVIGPADDPKDLWGRTVQLLAGKIGPTLAGRSEFAGLRARFSREYPGLLYVVWPEGDATALGGCDRLLVGVAVDQREIACELRGHREPAREDLRCFDAASLGALPADSVAVWSGGFDFSAMTGGLAPGAMADGDPLLRFCLKTLTARSEGGADLREQLGPGYAVVVGAERPAAPSGKAAPTVPMVTALVETTQGEECVARLDRIIGFLGRVYLTVTPKIGKAPNLPGVVRREFEGVSLHEIEIGSRLAERTGWQFLDGVQPCWALLDGRLVLSTSSKHVEQIVQASRRLSPRLDDTGGVGELLPRDARGEAVAEWVCLRGSAVASMFASWLNYARQTHREALQPQWWRSWAAERLEQRGRLGVGLVDGANGLQAVVREIRRDSPAVGHLRPGDVIVGAAGKPLPTTRPAREVARRYRERGVAEEFELEVIRKGNRTAVKIPVPTTLDVDLRGFDPVNAIRQVIALARPAETVTAWRYASDPGRYDARILIRWGPAMTPRKPVKADRAESTRP